MKPGKEVMLLAGGNRKPYRQSCGHNDKTQRPGTDGCTSNVPPSQRPEKKQKSTDKRFDWNEMRFRLSKQPYTDLPETVIIDEASMLTEEMFGALMEAIGTVKRIIFVGDPNQLPPIGSGKPFVDLVNLLREELPARSGLDTPRVCNCYGELRINRRQQKEEERLDVNLSRCFTRTEELDDEEVPSRFMRKFICRLRLSEVSRP